MSNTTPNNKPSKALGILRVSTNAQDNARQRADLERLRKKFGITIIETIELDGISGRKVLRDPRFLQILADVGNRSDVDGLAFSSIDRYFRTDRYSDTGIFQPLSDHHKVIWSVREGMVEPWTDEGFDVCMTAALKSGAEWRELRRRTNDGKVETAESGCIPHGNPKFGWDIIGRKQTGVVREGRAVINEAEAAIAREMFERRRAGMATYAIALWLNEQGIRNKRGSNGQPPRPWSCSTVLQVLRSTDYIGKHYWRGILIPIPPIVTEELFYTVQAQMQESRKQWSGRPSTQGRYRLRNFIFCERCKHRLKGVRNGKTLTYLCSHRSNTPPMTQLCRAPQISAAMLERTAWQAIWSLLKDPGLLYQMGRKHYDEQSKPVAPVATHVGMQHDIDRLRQRERNLSAEIPDALNDEECSRLRQERNDIRVKIAALEVELRAADKTVILPPLTAVEMALERIANRPEPFTYEEQRSIMERIIDLRMEYANGHLTITGKIPICTPDDDTSGGTVRTVTVQKNSSPRVHGAISNVIAIPFKIQREVL